MKTPEEFLEEINCFNTIYLRREKESNTMAKIMKTYANYHTKAVIEAKKKQVIMKRLEESEESEDYYAAQTMVLSELLKKLEG